MKLDTRNASCSIIALCSWYRLINGHLLTNCQISRPQVFKWERCMYY